MNITDGKNKVTWTIKFMLILFIIIPFFLIYVIYDSTSLLYEQILDQNKLLIFEKGDFYMLGVSIALFSAGILFIVGIWFNKSYTPNFVKITSYICISGLIIMFLFPQILHFYVADFTEANGYTKCEKNSYQALKFKTYTYAKQTIDCEK